MGQRLEEFYADLVWALDEHLHRGGTTEGAAVVAKRVAKKHGVKCADHISLPRLSREMRDTIRWQLRDD